MPSDIIGNDGSQRSDGIQTQVREHYAHFAKNSLSEQSLRKIYVSMVGPGKESDLVRFIESVDGLMTGDASACTESVIFEGLSRLGQDVVLKYLIGLKIAILLPALEAGASERWEDVNLEKSVFLLRRLKSMINVINLRNATIH